MEFELTCRRFYSSLLRLSSVWPLTADHTNILLRGGILISNAAHQRDLRQSRLSSVVLNEKKEKTGNKQTGKVQCTRTASSLTTPKRLEGERCWLLVEQWHRTSVREMREKKPERRSSTCHSCQTLLVLSSRFGRLLWGPFISQRWWVMRAPTMHI